MLLEEALQMQKLSLEPNIQITVTSNKIDLLLFLIGITNGSVVTLAHILTYNASVLVKSSMVTMSLQMERFSILSPK